MRCLACNHNFLALSICLNLIVLLSFSIVYYSYKYFKNAAKVIHSKEHRLLVIVLKDWHPKVGLKGRSYKYHKDYRTRCSRTRQIRLLASQFNYRPTILWKLNPLLTRTFMKIRLYFWTVNTQRKCTQAILLSEILLPNQ